MNLQDVVNRVEANYPSVADIENYLEPYKTEHSMWPLMMSWIREPGGYYRKLGPLIREIQDYISPFSLGKEKNIDVLEIGTYSGLSAMMFAQYSRKVISLDINHANLYQEFRRINPACDVLFWHTKPLDYQIILSEQSNKFDVIFIDIGDHDGTHEKWIHDYLIQTKWKGIALYDDINWNDMWQFWCKIEQKKIATDWHDGTASFGIVEYV